MPLRHLLRPERACWQGEQRLANFHSSHQNERGPKAGHRTFAANSRLAPTTSSTRNVRAILRGSHGEFSFLQTTRRLD